MLMFVAGCLAEERTGNAPNDEIPPENFTLSRSPGRANWIRAVDMQISASSRFPLHKKMSRLKTARISSRTPSARIQIEDDHLILVVADFLY